MWYDERTYYGESVRNHLNYYTYLEELNKRTNGILEALQDTRDSLKAYQYSLEVLEGRIRAVCDFNARVTYLESDGFMVLNEDTSNVAPLSCVKDKTAKNKLTEQEHESLCV